MREGHSAEGGFGTVAGPLKVNGQGCFSVGDRVMLAAYEASILPDGAGISLPGRGDFQLGDRVSGRGGELTRPPKEFESCLGGKATTFVTLR